MVDTVRSIADVLLLLADNSNGDVSQQDLRDAVVSLEALTPSIPIDATITSQGVGFGEFYVIGFYDCQVTDANLTQVSTTVTHGSALQANAAHAVATAGGAGTTDGSDLVLTVTGTSITDAGVRTTGDSEILIGDCTVSAINNTYETAKKWLGQITYTLTSSGGSTFAFDMNYGFASYNDLGNTDFTLDSFGFEWLAGATDGGFDIDIHRHELTGWTYHATAFHPGSAPLYTLSTDYVTERSLINGKPGKWKRTGLSDAFTGSGLEGVIVHATTTVNNSVEWLNASLKVKPA